MHAKEWFLSSIDHQLLISMTVHLTWHNSVSSKFVVHDTKSRPREIFFLILPESGIQIYLITITANDDITPKCLLFSKRNMMGQTITSPGIHLNKYKIDVNFFFSKFIYFLGWKLHKNHVSKLANTKMNAPAKTYRLLSTHNFLNLT